tara:strand:+ start:3031 stop:3873 length:843 start_codon:yes stop_codon:yes gene_type:complete
MNKWTIKELSRQVHVIEWNVDKPSEECTLLLMSDEHWDNKECDRDLLRRHHEEAVKKGAPILKFGDTFCAMQGKWDKRADMNQLRPEHHTNKYLDSLVNTATEWYKPYKDNIALITPGNHEQSILDRHETDLIDRLTSHLGIAKGDYWGYVLLRLKSRERTQTHVLHYHHGYGGGGEVTRGMIDNNRTRGQYDADLFYSGHIHRRNYDENVITTVTAQGRLTQRTQRFLRGSTYKNETRGWHASGGRAGRPLGGWWVTIKDKNVSRESGHQLLVTCTPAT